jgi:hypothetical protein
MITAVFEPKIEIPDEDTMDVDSQPGGYGVPCALSDAA